jgi:RimJ/RimL family protein N-acetyltransferase
MTERLVMRGWRAEDFERWARICSDAEVMRGLGVDGAMSPAAAWRDMAMLAGHWVLRGFGHWVLEERESGRVVGRAGLNHPPDYPGLEVGWLLAREDWGRGFATEAARAAASWAREELGARRLISLILPENRGSIAVAERLGARLEGHTTVRGMDARVYGVDLPLPAASP